MLRVRRSDDIGRLIFILSGRIEEKHIQELRELVDAEAHPTEIVLDLEEVRLVDQDAVGFLADCEAKGIELMNCPSYVRKWIDTRSDTDHEP